MKKEKKFCSYCGGKISKTEAEGKIRDFCDHCCTIYYENPLPVASSIVVNDHREVLLVQREKDPYKGMWCLPIGFAESGEEVSTAALRELKEEAGIDGEIIKLIDVDTVDNYFYGPLAIVAYEVKKTGGEIKPGDDALDTKYFPITNLPKLAWSSNEKAIAIYIALYKDTWAMMDLFKEFSLDIHHESEISKDAHKQKQMITGLIRSIIQKEKTNISKEWAQDILKIISGLSPYLEFLIQINNYILDGVGTYLEGKILTEAYFSQFQEVGKDINQLNLPMADILTAMALSRKSIWLHVVKKNLLLSPLEIYSALEINNRIIFFYDKINYFITTGYFDKQKSNASI